MRLLLALLLALPMVGAVGSPVLAATCSGNGCNGTSPETTGCAATASTYAYKWIFKNNTLTRVGKAELRHSSACGTWWTRITSSVGAATLYEAVFCGTHSYSDVDYGATSGYSPQVYSPSGSVCPGLGGSGAVNGNNDMENLYGPW
jgi:hypothetical protein